MRTLLEPAGFFLEAPVPGFLPSLHVLTSSLLRLQRSVLATSHVGTYALPTALRYQNVQQKERGMSVFPGGRTSENCVTAKLGIAPAQTAKDRWRASHAPMGIMFLMYTTVMCT